VVVLQEAKKDFFFAKTAEQKKDIEERSKKQFAQMLKELEKFLSQFKKAKVSSI
jgi:hypothetical protein